MADDCGCEPGDPGEPVEEIEEMAFPELMEMGNLQVAASVLGQGAAAAGARRIDRADQISGDSQSSWTIAMQTPTNLMANALRTTSESGGGSSRLERNPPYITTTPIISTPKDA
jgi:hypothetical protein